MTQLSYGTVYNVIGSIPELHEKTVNITNDVSEDLRF